MPQTELHLTHFLDFCHVSIGVSPPRILADLHEWLEEDAGSGDVTLFATLKRNHRASVFVVAKEDFILAGLPLMAQLIRETCGDDVTIYSDLTDGQFVRKGTVILGAKGPAGGLLLCERACLNLGSRLSGIATKTHSVSQALAKFPSAPTLLETRKTTPGLRLYEKYATRVGGARNHRHGLDSGAMLKENHIRAVGDLVTALRFAKERVPVLTKVEVEVTNLNEFELALKEGADVIMLDNFSSADINDAITMRARIGSNAKIELSGNLDKADLTALAESGADYISMGALIHQATWVDMSMQLYS